MTSYLRKGAFDHRDLLETWIPVAVLFLIRRMVNMHNGIHLIKSRINVMPNGGAT
jgi:hypothetical protein